MFGKSHNYRIPAADLVSQTCLCCLQNSSKLHLIKLSSPVTLVSWKSPVSNDRQLVLQIMLTVWFICLRSAYQKAVVRWLSTQHWLPSRLLLFLINFFTDNSFDEFFVVACLFVWGVHNLAPIWQSHIRTYQSKSHHNATVWRYHCRSNVKFTEKRKCQNNLKGKCQIHSTQNGKFIITVNERAVTK